VQAVKTDKGEIACAQVVLAAGAGTLQIAKHLGVRPAIYPVKGYSATYAIRNPDRIPKRPIVDETCLVAVNRLGGRLRVSAIAEFAEYDRSTSDERTAYIDGYVREHFGDAVDLKAAEHWAGLRPTTPGGAPYLGRLRAFENAWINAGHGQLGWTMAAGACRVLAKRINGEPAQVEDISEPAAWLIP